MIFPLLAVRGRKPKVQGNNLIHFFLFLCPWIFEFYKRGIFPFTKMFSPWNLKGLTGRDVLLWSLIWKNIFRLRRDSGIIASRIRVKINQSQQKQPVEACSLREAESKSLCLWDPDSGWWVYSIFRLEPKTSNKNLDIKRW